MKRLFVVGFIALLSACASTTIYGPAGPSERSVGYSDIRIEDNRWRVTFTAAPDISRAQTERFALRRAAELTVENGYDWFRVIARRTEIDGGGDGPVNVGGSVGTTIGSGGYRASGVGLGLSISPSAERRTYVELEILAFEGEPPQGDPDAYDPRQLLANSGAAI